MAKRRRLCLDAETASDDASEEAEEVMGEEADSEEEDVVSVAPLTQSSLHRFFEPHIK